MITLFEFGKPNPDGVVVLLRDAMKLLAEEGRDTRFALDLKEGNLVFASVSDEPYEESVRKASIEHVLKKVVGYPASFVEPGSGLKMEIGKGYLLSDSGSFWYDQGFEQWSQAMEWLAKNHPEEKLEVPVFNPKDLHWGGFDGACNFVWAEDLWLFWVADVTMVRCDDGAHRPVQDSGGLMDLNSSLGDFVVQARRVLGIDHHESNLK